MRKALFNLEDWVMASLIFQANHTHPDLHPSFVRKLAFPLTYFSSYCGRYLATGRLSSWSAGNGWTVVVAPKQWPRLWLSLKESKAKLSLPAHWKDPGLGDREKQILF